MIDFGYSAADGWTPWDMTVIHLLTDRWPDLLIAHQTRARLLNWITEAETKEPAR
jgi:hypothetical protein